MSHFYGTLQGNRGEATRGGSKDSGIVSNTASWQGCVHTEIHHDERTGQDIATVVLRPWHGCGTYKTLYKGPVSGEPVKETNDDDGR